MGSVMSIRVYAHTIALTVGLVLVLSTDVSWSDRIIFESGQVKEGRIHDENFVFPEQRDNPNFIEMEVLDPETNTITVFAFDMRDVSPIREVIREPFEFPPDALPSVRLQRAMERHQREQEERLARATPTPSAAVPLPIEVELARGWFLKGADADAVRLVAGLKVVQGDRLRTRYNSRGRLCIGETLLAGFDVNVAAQMESAVWDQINRRYFINIPLEHGQIWFENRRGQAEVRTVELSLPPFAIVMGEGLFRIDRSPANEWRVALYEGRDFSLSRGGAEIAIRPGEELRWSTSGEQSTAAVDVSSARGGLRAWDDWKPVEVKIDLDLLLPEYVLPEMAGLEFALPSLARPDAGHVGMPPRSMTLAQALDAYRNALDNYREDVGEYPSPAQGLGALREDPGLAGWNGPYVPLSLAETDPWGRAFIYRILKLQTGETIADVYCAGPNGIDEQRLGDDIY